jgi:hypothetical protein
MLSDELPFGRACENAMRWESLGDAFYICTVWIKRAVAGHTTSPPNRSVDLACERCRPRHGE